MPSSNLNYYDQDEIKNLLIGRRIVEVKLHATKYDAGMLVLDDGTIVYVHANDGCGGCTSGYYQVKKLATCDNIITNVRFHNDPSNEYSSRSGEGVYEIYVFADAQEINIMRLEGTDGNGYYGTGYELEVVLSTNNFME